jgi:hypothetical protein
LGFRHWPIRALERMERVIKEFDPLIDGGGYIFGTSNKIFQCMHRAHYEYMLEVYREFCAEGTP